MLVRRLILIVVLPIVVPLHFAFTLVRGICLAFRDAILDALAEIKDGKAWWREPNPED